MSFCDLRMISQWNQKYSNVSNSSLQKQNSGESTVLNLKSICLYNKFYEVSCVEILLI